MPKNLMRLVYIVLLTALPLICQTKTASPKISYTGTAAAVTALPCTVGMLAFASDATAGQQIYECSATNTWTQQLNSGSGGANTALSNLSAVSINTSLLAQTGVDAGSAAKPFREIFWWGTGTYGSTSMKITGVPTGNRVWTFPDATDTVVGLATTNAFTGTNSFSAGISTGASPPAVTFGTGGGIASAEGTAPSVGLPATAVDGCYADSTAHGYKCSFNNDTASKLVRASDFGTNVGTFLATPSGANLTSALTTALTAGGGGTGVAGTAHGNSTHVQISDGTGASGNLASFDANGNVTDGSVVAANAVTAASAAAAANQPCVASGASKTCTYIDFPMVETVPAANCNNTTAGASWSIGSGGTVTCRAGTNNLAGFVAITDTSSTFAQFMLSIPADWSSGVRPYILLAFQSATDTTNGHTVIPEVAVSCTTATNGTASDDITLSAYQSLTTVTFGASAVAHGFYTTSVQLGSTQMSGCIAGGSMIVSVGRATDTATGVIGFYYANVTFPRRLVVQAN